MTKKIEETQGHRKLAQFVEDLKRNKHFIKDVANLEKLLASKNAAAAERDETARKDEEGVLTNLLDKYMKLDEQVQKILDKPHSLFNVKFQEVADKYGLSDEILSDLVFYRPALGTNGKEIPLGEIFDFCAITDGYDENFNPEFPSLPFILNTRKQAHLNAFPVSIDIHKFASKRDVLRFIEKRWDIIESFIAPYREGKKIRIRARTKVGRDVTDFIWEHKKLAAKQIKQEVEKKFPGVKLAYNEISKLISIEKSRRSKKLL